MDRRRFTMTNPTAVFSILAHEAWDQKSSEKETDDNGHNASQRSRRRYTVSDTNFSYLYFSPSADLRFVVQRRKAIRTLI